MYRFIAVATLLAAALPTMAADARCAKPPYGATEIEFRAFAQNFAGVMPATQWLPFICMAKFDGVGRQGLYNVGLTDKQIENESVGQLAVDSLDAMHTTLRKMPPAVFEAFIASQAGQQPVQQQPQPVPPPHIAAPMPPKPAEISPGPQSEQRIRECVQSPEMANQGDAFRKCQARVFGYQSPADLPGGTP